MNSEKPQHFLHLCVDIRKFIPIQTEYSRILKFSIEKLFFFLVKKKKQTQMEIE